jgi:hypothetical protein
MPLKSLNKAWDEVDPNMAIPTDDNANIKIVDKSISSNNKVSDLEAAHVEEVDTVEEGTTKA